MDNVIDRGVNLVIENTENEMIPKLYEYVVGDTGLGRQTVAGWEVEPEYLLGQWIGYRFEKPGISAYISSQSVNMFILKIMG